MADSLAAGAAARIAWRDLRSSPAKFLFVILAVAAGVGALTGVRGFSVAFRGALVTQARALMAADLSIRLREYPTPDQKALVDQAARESMASTWVTEMVSMAASANAPYPQMVSLKAVDPKVYPLYGEVKLSNGAKLSDTLDERSLVASDDLPLRLKVSEGGTIRLGGQEYRVAALITGEPDRLAGSPNPGMRVILSRAGLERAGLLQPGSRSSNRFLFRLPADTDPAPLEDRLRKAMPEAQVLDYRETDPAISRGLDNSTTFLSLVSLIALIVGALGVAMAMYAHLQQRLDTVAILKCLGGTWRQILAIYLMETLALGLAGGVLGILLGAGVQRVFPELLGRWITLRPEVSWHWTFVVQGLAIGVLTTLLFTIPPLLRVRKIRPNLILRRNMDDAQPHGVWRRLAGNWPSLAASAILLGGLDLIAVWLSQSWRVGSYFLLGLLAALAGLSAVAWVLLRGLRWFLRRTPWRLAPTVRHGIANLYRPGNQASSVLVALGVGVMFTMTTWLVQHSVIEEISSRMPSNRPNVFLIDVTERNRQAFGDLLKAQPGIERPLELIPTAVVRPMRVNGESIDTLPEQDRRRRFNYNTPVTWSDGLPGGVKVLRGAWWKAGDTAPRVSVSENAAKFLHLEPGGTIEFRAGGRTLSAAVAAVHKAEENSMALGRFGLIFTPATFAGMTPVYYGGVRVKPDRVRELQRVVYERFPTITVINMADTMALIQEVVDQVALVIRFLAGFAIVAGMIILASSVAGTRFRRVREVVILKTLGGTRRRVAAIFSVEFLILGLVAGGIGALLATAFSNILWNRFFEGDRLPFHWPATLVTLAATALLANLAGWLASFRILDQKPLEILREE